MHHVVLHYGVVHCNMLLRVKCHMSYFFFAHTTIKWNKRAEGKLPCLCIGIQLDKFAQRIPCEWAPRKPTIHALWSGLLKHLHRSVKKKKTLRTAWCVEREIWWAIISNSIVQCALFIIQLLAYLVNKFYNSLASISYMCLNQHYK